MLDKDESSFIEVSNILGYFDVDQIHDVISEQLQNILTTDNTMIEQPDHFRNIYYNYNKLKKYNLDDSTKDDAETKFTRVCYAFINGIADEFGLSVDTNWLSDNRADIPAITYAIYLFFVKDLAKNIHEALYTYINENKESLAKTFEDYKNKKDASTLLVKKTLSPDLSLILANIYDVSEYIFENLMDEEVYFKSINQDYVPLSMIQNMYEAGYMSGTFMKRISEAFHENLSLKSDICFQIIYSFANNSETIESILPQKKEEKSIDEPTKEESPVSAPAEINKQEETK